MELAKLIRAGFVTARKSATDGRVLKLALTSSGKSTFQRLTEGFVKDIEERFVGYTREHILQCVRLLRDFSAAPYRP